MTRAQLRDHLANRYNTSAAEHDAAEKYTCRRCRATVGWDNGTDGPGTGLCDDCWCRVDGLLGWAARA